MATAWLYVINSGSGTPNIVRRSHSGTTVAQVQPGEYVVTFPPFVSGLACVHRGSWRQLWLVPQPGPRPHLVAAKPAHRQCYPAVSR